MSAVNTFRSLWDDLAPLGRDPRTRGYHRHAWTGTDLDLRHWFAHEAGRRGLDVETDGNGNQWAWWGAPGPDAVITGSHLDSVPNGGAYDGPLGVVCALLAVDALRARGIIPARPFAVVNFTEEEGSRFGIACLGSRLMTGALDADRALALKDRDGNRLADALTEVGHDARRLGADPERLARVGTFVELHVEQGRALVDMDRPVGVASTIWPHGRYRFDIRGRADHAGTTRMEDRADPMLTYAAIALAAARHARAGGRRATFGRLDVVPNGTNAIPSQVTAWLDARCADEETLDSVVALIEADAAEHARADGTTVHVTPESVTPAITFPPALAARVAGAGDTAPWPLLPTQAGHDAGILAAAGAQAAMLFVRNPSGVSHSPEEYAEEADCVAGVEALTDVLVDLLEAS
ncbi:allantoate amidohydrolase [Streptomyces sp. BBFR102]|uniref:allantoate amidohydrolase n=1 Tax=Streptomyces sp. BBFR102 TaxID=3448171 RepID=UPI003F53043E